MNPSKYYPNTPTLLTSLYFWLSLSLLAFASPPQPDFFSQHIRPLFKERCFACHGALKQEANLRVDTAASIILGGDSGPTIKPHHPDDSLLLTRITSSDLSTRMPPEGHALTPKEIDSIKTWISNGAHPPTEDQPEPAPTDHWAFQPITRPPISIATQQNSFANPIDHFLSIELTNRQISPLPVADPSLRIRRLYLDLIGVPPTPQQLDLFLNDSSPDSYNQLAIRLLNSPQHGERWARHWMDIWRYADWFGRRYVPDVWNSAPQIWHWRDWIVRSLNDDVGYDQMIQEMLAADEIKPGDPTSAVATGFLIRNWYALNPNDWMRSNVEHTGKAFLGLTFQCAHCHDHKYDPITQEDYFSFRAFFEPIGIRQDRIPGQPDPGPFQEYEYSTQRKVQRLGIVSIFDKTPDSKTFFYTNGDERNRVNDHSPIHPNVPKFLAHHFVHPIDPLHLPPQASYPGLNPELRIALQNEAQQKIDQARDNLTQIQSQCDSTTNSSTLQSALAKLHKAETQYNNEQLRAETSSADSSESTPLAGLQSLLLNATVGRRMIFRSLPEVNVPFSQALISFDIALLSQAHFNFQLTRDSSQGLTATFVGFENGEIRAYQPNSFQEFVVAKLDISKPSHRFHVELQVDLKKDQCLLTIQTLSSRETIANNIPIALNQWNPYNDITKGILFDARPGALAAVDNISLNIIDQNVPTTTALLQIDFEPSDNAINSELIPTNHWQSLSFSNPPADSRIVNKLPSITTLAREKELAQLQRAANRPQLKLLMAKAQLVAAQADLEALQATILADNQKALLAPNSQLSTELRNLTTIALELQRLAKLRHHEANSFAAEYALAECEAKPDTDSNRNADIVAATSALNQAFAALNIARNDSQLTSSESYQPLTRTYPTTSTGRRKALAEWITHRDNPLTARVAVNHIWMRHFHKPLVPNVFDFGRSSPSPKQLALLNWLAAELIESNWSMKRIHYLIVTSQAFQRSSSITHPNAQSIDPDNELYWRMNTGRMEAEVIRDSLLHVANSLERTFGGQELENNLSFTTYRRSLYYCCQPEEDGKSPIGQLFDGPDPTDCYRRTRTIIPQQALALTNSPLIHQVANKLYDQLQQQLPHDSTPANYITLAYKSILNRNPSQAELNYCQDFLASTTTPTTNNITAQPSETANRYIGLLRVLFNHNDFVTIR
jgi:mono/diheme cytochrome c family protein